MHQILLVEDIVECQLIVKRALASSEINLVTLDTVKAAQDLLFTKGSRFDLVILDLGLPDGEGLTILEQLRSHQTGGRTSVFLLTSHSELDSKVTAFNLGADDYLVKPISGVELRARVEMRLRKSASSEQVAKILKKANLTLDISLMRASIEKEGVLKDLPLTAKEFKILALMLQNEGKVYSRQDIVKIVWGDKVHVLKRTVDSHIFGLRKKLDIYADYVECIPNVGYRFVGALQPNVAKKGSHN